MACVISWIHSYLSERYHLMSKWIHHLPLKLHLPLEFHRVRSWDLFCLFCSYPRLRVSFNQPHNCQTRTQLFLFINMLMTLGFIYWYIQTHPHSSLKSLHLNPAPCIRVNNWLLQNGLHLNPSKSEAIAFFNPRSS